MPTPWDWDFVTIPFLLASMTIAMVLGLFMMSYMSSEEESAAEWFARDILQRGGPRDERALQKKRAAKMERLLNEKIRVSSPKRTASSTSTGSGAGSSHAAGKATGTAAEAAKARHRKEGKEGKDDKGSADTKEASELKKAR